MRSDRPHVKLILLLALWVSAAVAAPASTPETQPAPTRAEQFDRVLARVIGPSSMDSTFEAYGSNLEQLHALLPAGDVQRDVQFRSVYCSSDKWTDLRKGLAYADDAQRRALAIHDLASQARAQFCRVSFVQSLEGTRKALADADKMVAMLQGSPERQLLGEGLMLRGELLSQLGEQAKALLDFQRARASFRDSGIDHEVDALMLDIAITYRRIGDWPQAEQYFTSSLAQMEDRGNWERVSTNLMQLGYLYDESGNAARAKTSFERAAAVSDEHHDSLGVAIAQVGLASTQVSLGEYDDALASLTAARTHFDAERNHDNDDMLLLVTGRALAGKGKHEEALANYQRALPLIQHDGNQRYLALLYRARSASKEALGQQADALTDYKRYSDLQSQLQGKMRFEQSRLLQYEYEIRRRDFENRRLRAEATSRLQQVKALESVRRWQRLAILFGALLVTLLIWLAIRQWRKSRALRTLAMTDPLTGVATRRAIESLIDQKLARAVHSEHPLCVLMLDLDHFKAINDRYGHPAGDRVLQRLTAVWTHLLRVNDRLGRVGGEEFLILCPDVHLEQARAVADRLLEATRAQTFPDIDASLIVAVSIGVVEASLGESRDALVARVDAALYRAKHNGRDRVES